jgi:uncharacterized membrane protein YdjX (TVP38/TMEM64 family)
MKQSFRSQLRIQERMMRHTKREASVSRALRVIVASASRLLLILLLFLSTETIGFFVHGFNIPFRRPGAIHVVQQQHSITRPSPSSWTRHVSFTSSPKRSSLLYLANTMILSSSSVMLTTGSNHSASPPPPPPLLMMMTKNNASHNNQMISPRKRQQMLKAIPKLSVLVVVIAALCWKRHALLNFMSYVKNEWLVTTLLRLNAAGPLGLVLYTLAFLVWEMTFGMTTPVEVASGMAFGAVPAIIANGIGKTGGAVMTFLLAQHVFSKRLETYIQENEMLSLMQESIQEMPLRVALLCRFSPLPELVKNAGMGVMAAAAASRPHQSSLSQKSNSDNNQIPRSFFASLVLHGFSFTCLWTCLGAETARVLLHSQPPSAMLKTLVTGATWIGVAAPVLIGIWIKSLQDKQQERRSRMQQQQQRPNSDDDGQADDDSSSSLSSSPSSSLSLLATDSLINPNKSPDTASLILSRTSAAAISDPRATA